VVAKTATSSRGIDESHRPHLSNWSDDVAIDVAEATRAVDDRNFDCIGEDDADDGGDDDDDGD
jgi:hypothetical protein